MSPSSILVVAALFLSACSPANKARVDELNEQSYAYHYRNLDSTKVLAERVLKLSEDYPSGRAEAYNNLAFVCIAKMDYKGAKGWLKKIEEESDNPTCFRDYTRYLEQARKFAVVERKFFRKFSNTRKHGKKMWDADENQFSIIFTLILQFVTIITLNLFLP